MKKHHKISVKANTIHNYNINTVSRLIILYFEHEHYFMKFSETYNGFNTNMLFFMIYLRANMWILFVPSAYCHSNIFTVCILKYCGIFLYIFFFTSVNTKMESTNSRFPLLLFRMPRRPISHSLSNTLAHSLSLDVISLSTWWFFALGRKRDVVSFLSVFLNLSRVLVSIASFFFLLAFFFLEQYTRKETHLISLTFFTSEIVSINLINSKKTLINNVNCISIK